MIIKNIFLPEKIKHYYLFPKHIVGIDITKTHINVTRARLQGYKTTIEDYFTEKIETPNNLSYEERLILALARVKERISNTDEIYTTISSSLIVFKELQLPFDGYEKINMVVNFEIEPLLPFPLHNAVIDFIITKQIPSTHSTEILVAAAQKEHITHHIQLLEQAGIVVSRIIVDLFALYSLYQQIPDYRNLMGSVALIDIGIQSTRIAYIQDGQLRLIRTLPQGLSHIAKMMSESLHITVTQAMDSVIRFGFTTEENRHYLPALTESMGRFFDTINFTLSSFHAQIPEAPLYTHILLLGSGADVHNIAQFASKKLNIPCELFDSSKIMHINNIEIKSKNVLNNASINSIALVIPSRILEHFNLRKEEFSVSDYSLLLKQLLMGGVLTILLLCIFVTTFLIQTIKLSNELSYSQTEAIDELKQRFKSIEPEENSLEEALGKAREELTKEEQTWFAFSNQARASFLQYLLELTNKIDVQSLGFSADQLSIKDGIMTLKAQVKDYDALKILERELRQSKFFVSVGPLEDPAFTVQIKLMRNLEG